MLDALKFAQGAVSTKQHVPELTHFAIREGRVMGYNGRMCLSAPIALDIECCPKAVPFVKAIEACDGVVEMHVTPTGLLSVRSGKFRSTVATLPAEVFPDVAPEGSPVALTSELLPALRLLYAFTAEDASRPWAAGVLLDGMSAFATNNATVVEYWLGDHFPYRVIVPRFTVKELLRIGEEPTGIQLNANNITFHYDGGRWLRSQLVDGAWPKEPRELLDCFASASACVPPPAQLFDALQTLAPFVGELNAVYFINETVATAREDGTSVELEGAPRDGVFNHKLLSLLEPVVELIGFDEYPNPVPFYGDRIRGAIMGMRA